MTAVSVGDSVHVTASVLLGVAIGAFVRVAVNARATLSANAFSVEPITRARYWTLSRLFACAFPICSLRFTGLNGRQMFGLQDDSVTYLLEQLAGAEQCRKYDFRFHRYAPSEEGVGDGGRTFTWRLGVRHLFLR